MLALFVALAAPLDADDMVLLATGVATPVPPPPAAVTAALLNSPLDDTPAIPPCSALLIAALLFNVFCFTGTPPPLFPDCLATNNTLSAAAAVDCLWTL